MAKTIPPLAARAGGQQLSDARWCVQRDLYAGTILGDRAAAASPRGRTTLTKAIMAYN